MVKEGQQDLLANCIADMALDGPDWKGLEWLNTQNGPSLAGGAQGLL
jgi:hypothetical protein